MMINASMTDAILHCSTKPPALFSEKKGQDLRPLEQNQGFVMECVDTEIPKRLIRA
jgi:hypothetical protein